MPDAIISSQRMIHHQATGPLGGCALYPQDGACDVILTAYTGCPNKKETRFISEISLLPRKIETNYMLQYLEHFLFFHLIPNT